MEVLFICGSVFYVWNVFDLRKCFVICGSVFHSVEVFYNLRKYFVICGSAFHLWKCFGYFWRCFVPMSHGMNLTNIR